MNVKPVTLALAVERYNGRQAADS